MRKIDGMPLDQAILAAAIPTFVERGYEKASMDEVSARASTTKRTVYAHFGNKDGLFRAALEKAVELFLSELPELNAGGDAASELERFALRFTEMCTWHGAVALQRVVIAEADRFPDLGALLHRDVIRKTERIVADYLSHLHVAVPTRKGRTEEDLVALASLFLNMTSGPRRFATLLGAIEPAQEHPDAATSAEIEIDREFNRRGVDLFLKGSGLSRG